MIGSEKMTPINVGTANDWSVMEEEEGAPARRDLFGAVTPQPLMSPLPL